MGLHGGTAESTLHTCILKAKVLKLIRSLFLRCLQKHDVIHSQGALPRIGSQFPSGPKGIQGVLPTKASQT